MAVATKLGSGNASLPVYELDFANGQNVTIGGTSVPSDAIASEVARIFTTADCYYVAGANPTAVTDGASAYLASGSGEYIGIKPGWKVAVIQVSGAGTLNIVPAVMR